jgi:hypothetical protein
MLTSALPWLLRRRRRTSPKTACASTSGSALHDELLERTDALSPYIERSLAYVLTLEAKPTKRPSSGR